MINEEVVRGKLFGDDDSSGDSKLQFKAEKHSVQINTSQPWKIFVVDDEQDIHTVTRIALKNLTFLGRGIEIIDTFSATECKTALAQHPDTSVILLDVVMESYNAGLELVKHIREELGNRFVRIILRTGQPGQVPEKEVISQYEINDFKTKVELTSVKLFTSVMACLRSYNEVTSIELKRRQLEQSINNTADSLTSPYAEKLLPYLSNGQYNMKNNFENSFALLFDENNPANGLWTSKNNRYLYTLLITQQSKGIHALLANSIAVSEMNEQCKHQPSDAGMLYKQILQKLQTSDNNNNASIVVSVFDTQTQELHYAGENIMLLVARNTHLPANTTELTKGNGIVIGKSAVSATNQTIPLQNGDVCYMATNDNSMQTLTTLWCRKMFTMFEVEMLQHKVEIEKELKKQTDVKKTVFVGIKVAVSH